MKNTTKIAVVLAALSTLGACAASPDKIAAVSMPTSPYVGLSCSELDQEETRLTNELVALSADQDRIVSADAWGVFLIGIPASAITGGDKETFIAVAKGRLDAISLVQSANCN